MQLLGVRFQLLLLEQVFQVGELFDVFIALYGDLVRCLDSGHRRRRLMVSGGLLQLWLDLGFARA